MSREIVTLYGKDPYLILISCLLSLQCRDLVTLPISKKLFQIVRTPEQMMQLSLSDLEKIIQSINYYKTKAFRLKQVSQEIIDRFGGKVPSTYSALISLPGVGPKTANLVLAEAFDVPAICVDTHVHRLSNQWGIVATSTPEQTEQVLRMVLPQKYWIEWNYYLVKWGQSICKTKRCDIAACRLVLELLGESERS